MSNTYNYKSENMGPASQEMVLNSASVIDVQPVEVRRVLRNTYALLALTLLFSAGVAATSLALQLPAPGLILTLVGYVGLLFAVHRLQNSGWGILAVFGLTGFMGYTLGPVLNHYLAMPGGAHSIALSLDRKSTRLNSSH